MNKRTEEQIIAYVDGYNDCFQQFSECLKNQKVNNGCCEKNAPV